MISVEESNSFEKGSWIPMMSLPKYLGVSSKNPIIKNQYLFTEQSMISIAASEIHE